MKCIGKLRSFHNRRITLIAEIERGLVFPIKAIGVAVVILVLIVFAFSWVGTPSKKDDSIPVLQLVGNIQMDGQPVTGCNIHVLSPWPRREKEATTKTDENGNYELILNSVRRNAKGYSVWARVPISPETELFAGANLIDGVRKRTPQGGPVRLSCDLAIPYRKGTLELPVIVQDRNKLPYAGEEIQLHAADRSFYLVQRLDAQGAATFQGLQPGNYHLQTLLPGRDRKAQEERVHRRLVSVFASAEVQLTASLMEPIMLMPGGIGEEQIQGRITLNGAPIPDACVSLPYLHGGYWKYHVPWFDLNKSECELHAYTDQDGNYTFSNLPDVSAQLQWKFTAADRELEIKRKIQTTVSVQDFPIVSTASIQGKVQSDGTGADLLSVQLIARSIRSGVITDIDQFYNSTWTTKQGDFLFENLPKGEYEIQQQVPLRGPRPSLLLETRRLRLQDGENYEITMHRRE